LHQLQRQLVECACACIAPILHMVHMVHMGCRRMQAENFTWTYGTPLFSFISGSPACSLQEPRVTGPQVPGIKSNCQSCVCLYTYIYMCVCYCTLVAVAGNVAGDGWGTP